MAIPNGLPPSAASAVDRAPRTPWRAVVGWVFAIAVAAALVGLDTRPNWDDTGIEAGLVFLAAFTARLAGARPFALAALVVGGGIPAVNLVLGRGGASALALLFALAGAGAAEGLVRVLGVGRSHSRRT